MRKWKQDYLLQKKQLQENESGITLVELLAVLAIMSVIIMLGGAIHMFGQNQFRAQRDSASQNNDYSYAMTVMSSDLRKVPLSNVDNNITLNGEEYLIEIKDGPNYSYGNGHLYRDGEKIIEDLNARPNVEFGKNENKIDHILIQFSQTNSKAGNNNKDYQTTIYFRGEPADD